MIVQQNEISDRQVNQRFQLRHVREDSERLTKLLVSQHTSWFQMQGPILHHICLFDLLLIIGPPYPARPKQT